MLGTFHQCCSPVGRGVPSLLRGPRSSKEAERSASSQAGAASGATWSTLSARRGAHRRRKWWASPLSPSMSAGTGASDSLPLRESRRGGSPARDDRPARAPRLLAARDGRSPGRRRRGGGDVAVSSVAIRGRAARRRRRPAHLVADARVRDERVGAQAGRGGAGRAVAPGRVAHLVASALGDPRPQVRAGPCSGGTARTRRRTRAGRPPGTARHRCGRRARAAPTATPLAPCDAPRRCASSGRPGTGHDVASALVVGRGEEPLALEDRQLERALAPSRSSAGIAPPARDHVVHLLRRVQALHGGAGRRGEVLGAVRRRGDALDRERDARPHPSLPDPGLGRDVVEPRHRVRGGASAVVGRAARRWRRRARRGTEGDMRRCRRRGVGPVAWYTRSTSRASPSGSTGATHAQRGPARSPRAPGAPRSRSAGGEQRVALSGRELMPVRVVARRQPLGGRSRVPQRRAHRRPSAATSSSTAPSVRPPEPSATSSQRRWPGQLRPRVVLRHAQPPGQRLRERRRLGRRALGQARGHLRRAVRRGGSDECSV